MKKKLLLANEQLRLYTDAEAQQILNTSSVTMWKLRRDGKIGYIRAAGLGIRYSERDLLEYLAKSHRPVVASK